jgi:molecular chaperone DnaJ
VPAGISNGEMIRMGGQGEAVSGGQSGDLYVRINVQADKVWKREGNDLGDQAFNQIDRCACLGVKQSIDGLDGAIEIDVPAGVSAGEVLAR